MIILKVLYYLIPHVQVTPFSRRSNIRTSTAEGIPVHVQEGDGPGQYFLELQRTISNMAGMDEVHEFLANIPKSRRI